MEMWMFFFFNFLGLLVHVCLNTGMRSSLMTLKREAEITIAPQGPLSGCFGAFDRVTQLSSAHGDEEFVEEEINPTRL